MDLASLNFKELIVVSFLLSLDFCRGIFNDLEKFVNLASNGNYAMRQKKWIDWRN